MSKTITMKIYANNIEFRIKERPIVKNKVRFQTIVSLWDDSLLSDSSSVLVTEESPENIVELIKKIIDEEIQDLKEITFSVRRIDDFKSVYKNSFKTIKAAGGIVENKDEVLAIKRHGLWDIPKGKIEKGEDVEEAAVREVEEECGVTVSLVDKICKTRHVYKYKGKYATKLTYWYRMKLGSDKNMKPQKEEGITEVKWMSKSEVLNVETYSSITGLLEKYYSS